MCTSARNSPTEPKKIAPKYHQNRPVAAASAKRMPPGFACCPAHAEVASRPSGKRPSDCGLPLTRTATSNPATRMVAAKICIVVSQEKCCINSPAAVGPTNVPTPVPASAIPDALLRCLMNQRCTAATVGTYTSPTPNPTKEQNHSRNHCNEPEARLARKKPSASEIIPEQTTQRVEMRSAREPENTPTT